MTKKFNYNTQQFQENNKITKESLNMVVSKTERQVRDMFLLQDRLNSKIDGDDWRNLGRPYYLAASVECVEAIQHASYKWWKKEESAIAQVKMELADIFFFILSEAMAKGRGASFVTAAVSYDGRYRENNLLMDLRWLNKTLSDIYIDDETRDDAFFMLMDCVYTLEMEFEDLYKLYVGKSVLNTFRQDNGYKEGVYDKIWDGREDNEVLTEICQDTDGELRLEEIQMIIYARLEAAYESR